MCFYGLLLQTLLALDNLHLHQYLNWSEWNFLHKTLLDMSNVSQAFCRYCRMWFCLTTIACFKRKVKKGNLLWAQVLLKPHTEVSSPKSVHIPFMRALSSFYQPEILHSSNFSDTHICEYRCFLNWNEWKHSFTQETGRLLVWSGICQ